VKIDQFHFAHPLWLWGGIAIPIVWVLFLLFYRKNSPLEQLEKFIDSHLLPYLMVKEPQRQGSRWLALLLWSVVWSCLTLALAGPRWSFREMETFSQDQSLVILLDLSESMNATDIKPTRLVRAKQKIEDLLNLSKGVKIGLIAFAADSHMITPVTEDKETVRHLLPSLETELIHVQGSRLSPALDMAYTLLEAEPGNNKALLVISDGGFEDATAILTAKKLADKGIIVHAMGIGTEEGAALNGWGNISKLEKERLGEISKAGKGRYLEGHYTDHEEAIILKELQMRADHEMRLGKKDIFWDEQFYLMILPALPVILWWFRKGVLFTLIFIFTFPAFAVNAGTFDHYFMNRDEIGKEALEKGNYEAATETFQDPYRKGVACYRAKHFVEAEKFFSQSDRPEVAANAAFNRGNCLVQQQKLKEAIQAYEEVLKRWPDHIKAKENLELVKKMLEEQKQNSSHSDKSQSQEDKNEGSSENNDKNQNQESNSANDPERKDSTEENKQANKNEPQENQPQEKDQNSSEEKDPEVTEKQQEKEEEAEAQNEKSKDSGRSQEELPKEESQEEDSQEEESHGQEQKDAANATECKSQEDQDADLWLNRISNDPKKFLKNKFYIESKKNGTKEGIDPW
jgi:Ca-activated chloride channel family protein